MCGRINVSSHPLAVLIMELAGRTFPGEDRYNVAPTEEVAVVRTARREVGAAALSRELASLRWWLTPYWSKDPSTRSSSTRYSSPTRYSMFNAKAETLTTSRAFREPFARRRCVVPVSGFYEWTRQNGQKLPHYIRPRDDGGMALAGIWDRWRAPDRTIESFAIVTVAVNERLRFVHTRQPAMLDRAQIDTWLDPGAPQQTLLGMLSPALPGDLSVVPVSTYVNNARNQGPRCIDPIGAPIEIARD